jgi:hypothetical protein
VGPGNPNDLKEQRPSGITKAVLVPGNAEGLAWKASTENIMRWNLLLGNCGEIADGEFSVVFLIYPLGLAVPVR